MSEITWEIIIFDIEDALEELNKLRKQISSGDLPDEVDFEFAMKHIYYHLNFAWNMRHDSIEDYANMTDEKSDKYGKFPEDLELL